MDGNVRTQKKCVIVERKWSFAPTYKELREIIRQLIDLHGADEVINELGLEDYLKTHEHYRCTMYKGRKIIWDDDYDKRIFEALDLIEEKYPDFFYHIIKIRESKGDISITIDNHENVLGLELPNVIDLEEDQWNVIIEEKTLCDWF